MRASQRHTWKMFNLGWRKRAPPLSPWVSTLSCAPALPAPECQDLYHPPGVHSSNGKVASSPIVLIALPQPSHVVSLHCLCHASASVLREFASQVPLSFKN